MRKCGRRINRHVRDRRTGMRLMERTRKLIPESDMVRHTEWSDQLYVTQHTASPIIH